METKHTKGTWNVIGIYKNTFSDDTLYKVSGSENSFCHSIKEMEANAKLIAAAPELLEALKVMLESSNAPEWKKELAIKAINKATK